MAKKNETDLIELERAYWEAIRDQDVDRAMSLTDDQCIVAGARGVAMIDRKAFVGMMSTANFKLHEFELSPNLQVRFLTDDVAIVAYDVREKATVEGKPVSMEAADTSVWVRRKDRWVCALHTESIRGDPWGRR